MAFSSVLERLAVPAFIVVWASGYVVAKLAATGAEPLSFLVLRYAGVCVLMGALALAGGAKWPSRRDALHIAVAGVLIQALYLGGVWVAIRMGLSAGVAALIVNLQPVLTVCLSFWTGERVTRRQVLGVAIGFIGVLLVLAAKLFATSGALGIPVVICVAALLGSTIGVLYQKRYVPSFDLRSGQVIQFAAAIVATLPFAWWFESFYLLRHGSVTRLTSAMYLVPGLTAVMAWLTFGETLGWNVIAGMAVSLFGIYLVVNKPAKQSTAR